MTLSPITLLPST